MSGSSQPGAGDGATTSMGLDPHIAGLLAYVLGLVSGLIIFLIEKEHREVRYHAAQSIIVSIALFVLSIALSILGIVPVVGWIIAGLGSALLGIGGLILWIYLMIQGYQLNHVRLPFAGQMAEQWASS